ncbi:MAG: hypothetical protein GQ527_12855, partial [Bacteroidales bacterium]|nr:hypothetical protein [Bacteroidales bacterium]
IEPELWKQLLKNGKNVLAIQNHNFWNQYPLVIKPWLSFAISDTSYQFDTISDLLPLGNLALHTNFKINGDGEDLYLSDSLGQIIQKFEVPALATNTSVGFHPELNDSLVFYTQPSPGEENGLLAKSDFIKDSIQLLHPSANYLGSIRVEVLNPDTNFIIRYTNDGSLPRDTSYIYDTAFYVDSTSVLRFRYFSDSLLDGPISDYTYFINDSSSLETFSLISDPYNLWDDDYGIYTLGQHHYGYPYYFNANFWQNWERPVHIQHFSNSKELFWEQDAGIKIHGNYTSAWDQKSFGLYAKSEYSQSRFKQAIIPNKPYIKNVKRFLIRNAGNDFHYAHLRDLLVQRRMQEENLDIQAGKPILCYLNGDYWGLYHLREKIDRFYLEDNWGIIPDSVNILEQNGLVISGSRNSFEDLMGFVRHNDLSNPTNYQYINNQIEIDNWIDNLISNLYHHNTDWPHHNTKFWNDPQHKWRQILVDQDVTMAYKIDNQAHQNSLLKIHTDTISYLAIIYQKLIQNQEFKIQYTNRFADLMNTIFLADEYLPLLDSIMEMMSPEMERHAEKWDKDYAAWMGFYTERIRTFINERSPYMRNHLREAYDLGVNDTITLAVEPQGKGSIKLNTIYIDENNWTGLYFDSIPIRLEAIPNPGYEFVRWESPTSPELADSSRLVEHWFLKNHDTISAIFYSPTGNEDTLQIAFTEINYRSYDHAEAGDWVELYNKESDTIDLSNWSLKGLKPYKNWKIPMGTKLAPQQRLLLVQDTNKFRNIHRETENFYGPFSFGLNSEEEQLSLWDELGRMVSIMNYTESSPWPDNKNTSRSIELNDIHSDYQLAENWQLACPGGSPGLAPQDCNLEIEIVFTELNYKSHTDYNSSDWLEIRNNETDSLDISHWIFRDGNPDNIYTIPAHTIITPNEFIILAQNTLQYFKIHDKSKQVFGPLNFGLSASGETISLSNQFGQEVISLAYETEDPWPDNASANGFTIELSDPLLPMHEGENWMTNCFLGTPLHTPS